MHTVYYLILVPMVYIAFAVFFLGSVVRLVRIFSLPKHPATLQIFPKKGNSLLGTLYDTLAMPTVRRHNPLLWIFLMSFHICLFLLILGHIELFGEISIFQIIPHEVFLGRGFVGLILSLCVLFFLARRFFSPTRDISIPEDYLILVLLLLTIVFGSEMDWARRWYEYGEMGVEEYREYLMSLLYFRPHIPEALMDSGHSFMLVLHVFFANLFIIFFPFSKIMHSFIGFAVNKLRRG